jgi:ATP-dependent DNA helicase DinG
MTTPGPLPETPQEVGLPYPSWRAGQLAAIARVLDGAKRVVGLVLPTGFGKSLVYMGLAKISGWQTVILTSTKALQRQLYRDFGDDETLVLVQGQSEYICDAARAGQALAEYADPEGRPIRVDHAPCHAGIDCPLKANGCGYFDTLRAAARAKIVITNYAWWQILVHHPMVKLKPRLLVLDEAHAAPDALSSALGARLYLPDTRRFLSGRAGKLATETPDPVAWHAWAVQALAELTARTYEAGDGRTLRKIRNLKQEISKISRLDPDTVVITPEADGQVVRFDPLWAAPHGEEYLFRHVPHVVLTSATMTPHTADLLGIMPKHFDFYEAGEGFPKDQRPVIVCPARTRVFKEPVKVDFRMTDEGKRAWLDHLDAFLGERADRKGIIHAVSYKRCDEILSRSKHRARMLTHTRRDTATQVERFKRSRPGTIFISPAMTTGYDFPLDECEFQILVKIPFPDGRDPVTKARTIVDAEYPAHLAMQELVQAVGRGMRSDDDRCETLVADAHALWFFRKNKHLAPSWFMRAVRTTDALPSAPPRVERFTVNGGAEE